MSIIIKGMKMPKNDRELLCVDIHPGGKVCINMDLECRKIAEAIELPPHGRLIDADTLLDELQKLFDKREEDARFSGNREVCIGWNDAIFRIKTAPTIIEAEVDEE